MTEIELLVEHIKSWRAELLRQVVEAEAKITAYTRILDELNSISAREAEKSKKGG